MNGLARREPDVASRQFSSVEESPTCEHGADLCAPRPSNGSPIMKRILSEVLRREDGVVQRNRRAGALRIEFIERSRNESLGIECVFAVSGGDCAERTDRPLDGVAASGAKTRDTYGRLEK